MKINVKVKDEDGGIHLDGYLNRAEVGFLLQYSINNLMALGTKFMIDKEESYEDEVRIVLPQHETVQ
jgi:hypothetical protein